MNDNIKRKRGDAFFIEEPHLHNSGALKTTLVSFIRPSVYRFGPRYSYYYLDNP